MRSLIWFIPICLTLFGQAKPKLAVEHVMLGSRLFQLEVAHTPETRHQGLMERKELSEGTGMLFVFPEERELSFWMCQCLIDLELVYLDAAGTIVDIQTMSIEPPRRRGEDQTHYEARLPLYKSKAPAQFAIELPVGTTDYTGLRVGDQISLDLEGLRRLVADEKSME